MPRKITVERDVLFYADMATVRRVLLETENYPNYIQNVQSAEVIYKNDVESEVSFKAKVSFFSFDYSVKTTAVSENRIKFEQKKGFFGFLNGEWRLIESNGRVEGKYIVNVKLPRFIAGKIVEKAINRYFPDMLKDFKNEIESQFRDSSAAVKENNAGE